MNNRKQLTTPKINIYISEETRKFLKEIQEKYFISFSTITNIIFTQYLKNLKKTNNLCEIIFDKNTTKTSIKPKNYELIQNFANNLKYEKGNKTILLSNLLFLFTTNKIKTYVKKYETFKTEIYNNFRKTKDKYYKYNSYCRNQPRFIKQNKEYLKKLLGE